MTNHDATPEQRAEVPENLRERGRTDDPDPEAGRTAETWSVATGASAEVALSVNGRLRKVVVEPRVTLLDALRERLGLTGTKKGCDRGECGVHGPGRW